MMGLDNSRVNAVTHAFGNTKFSVDSNDLAHKKLETLLASIWKIGVHEHAFEKKGVKLNLLPIPPPLETNFDCPIHMSHYHQCSCHTQFASSHVSPRQCSSHTQFTSLHVLPLLKL